MNYINNGKDTIFSLVKTMSPINYLYSKQSKTYDKFFRCSSLKGLIKQINSKPKINEFLKPGETLEDANKKSKEIMGINFKSTFNYLKELSDLKKLHIFLSKKNNYKIGKFSSSDEDISNNNSKNKNIKKKKRRYNILKIKNSGDADTTLDPGRYHPNYDYIKRRYPCAYLGRPKIKKELFHDGIEEAKKRNKTEDNKINKITNTRNNIYNRYHENIPNKSLHFKKCNISHTKMNFHSLPKSLSLNNNAMKIRKLNKGHTKIKKINVNNTISSWTHTIDLNKSSQKSISQIKTSNIKSKTNYYYYCNSSNNLTKNNKKFIKNISAHNLRCPIIFSKMPGRDRPINFVDGNWEGCRTNYNPDYNIIRPHIPSIIFKNKRKDQNYKKYITGKIIRSYCFNPIQYFVFEIKENKKNNNLAGYEAILSKS